jgi:hypothetical protein
VLEGIAASSIASEVNDSLNIFQNQSTSCQQGDVSTYDVLQQVDVMIVTADRRWNSLHAEEIIADGMS